MAFSFFCATIQNMYKEYFKIFALAYFFLNN